MGERHFASAAGPSLDSPLAELDPLFDGYPDDKEKWAPHAVTDGNTIHLFAGPGNIRHYVSKDGCDFQFAGNAIEGQWRWLRDTMVTKIGDRWIMYATDLVDGLDVVSAFRSPDL
jgi:hypothetical protein